MLKRIGGTVNYRIFAHYRKKTLIQGAA